jgi:hypothetical protein
MLHRVTNEPISDAIVKEEMAEKIIQSCLKYTNFDPYSGNKKPNFGFA